MAPENDGNGELHDSLDALANRGQPRGADAVLHGARARAAAAPNVRLRNGLMAVSVAACLALVVALTTVVGQSSDSKGRPLAPGSATPTTLGPATEPTIAATEPPTTATTAP